MAAFIYTLFISILLCLKPIDAYAGARKISDALNTDSGRVLQGLVLLKRFSNKKRFVVTQDLVSAGKNLFTVIDVYPNQSTKTIKSFEIESGSHVQSIVRRSGKCSNGKDGDRLYTPGPKGRGLLYFCLEKDLSKLHPPVSKDVYVSVDGERQKLIFSTIDFDAGGNQAVALARYKSKKYIFILQLNELLNSSAVTVLNHFRFDTNDESLNSYIDSTPVQGIAFAKKSGKDRYVYMFMGYRDIYEKKYLFKYDIVTGNKVRYRNIKASTYFAKRDGDEREPEGLYHDFREKTLYFTFATGRPKYRKNRIYKIHEDDI